MSDELRDALQAAAADALSPWTGNDDEARDESADAVADAVLPLVVSRSKCERVEAWGKFLAEYVDANHGKGISDRAWEAFTAEGGQ